MTAAGYGAEEQASRRARRLARLREEEARGAAVDAEVLRRAQQDQRNWSAGAEGERLVAASLASLERYGWTALHDVRWPDRQQANIDHIAIGPGGIVVIDAKNWSGRVAVAEGSLRQNGYSRASSAEGAGQAAAAVTALLAPQHRTAVRAVLCLAAQDQAPTPVKGVDVLGRWQLPEYLLGLPHRLSVYDVADIARYLGTELDRTRPSKPRAPRGKNRTRQPAQRRPAGRRKEGPGAALLRLVLTLGGLYLFLQFMMRLLENYAASISG
ncbi:nuclease-related domain-containing protein [Cellulomonas telluris]|uniref:nuclease-related domain-containing protein n=1 Tax=Cellulomonas telluris TaxID=2306636 RepID=UPI0010A8A8A2|nr:nuclease-related domain-containing protein [Cellulomonas telluris]